jgi:hypothetical protein
MKLTLIAVFHLFQHLPLLPDVSLLKLLKCLLEFLIALIFIEIANCFYVESVTITNMLNQQLGAFSLTFKSHILVLFKNQVKIQKNDLMIFNF